MHVPYWCARSVGSRRAQRVESYRQANQLREAYMCAATVAQLNPNVRFTPTRAHVRCTPASAPDPLLTSRSSGTLQ
jgi:hypothetical protein